jgi:uncharacterized membrane protein
MSDARVPDFLTRLQRGFVFVAIMAAIFWCFTRNSANQWQQAMLLTMVCGAMAGIVIIRVIRTLRK